MFICHSCREKNYENPKPLSGSYGPCEICGQVRECGEIHHSYLIPKKSNPRPGSEDHK